jgi:hypothetical protein
MLSFPPAVRIWLALAPADLRKGCRGSSSFSRRHKCYDRFNRTAIASEQRSWGTCGLQTGSRDVKCWPITLWRPRRLRIAD